MIITHVNNGKKAEVTVDGAVVTIGGQVVIDLQRRQSDEQLVIDVCLDNQLTTMCEGLGAWYVANIIVPSCQYEIDGEETVMRPIDMSLVECKLWSLPNTEQVEGTELQ